MSAIGTDVEDEIDIAVLQQAMKLGTGGGMDGISVSLDPGFSQNISYSI